MTVYVRKESVFVEKDKSGGIGFFEKHLTLWVALCMVIGIFIGKFILVLMIKNKGQEYFEKQFIPKFNNITIIGLLLTWHQKC